MHQTLKHNYSIIYTYQSETISSILILFTFYIKGPSCLKNTIILISQKLFIFGILLLFPKTYSCAVKLNYVLYPYFCWELV
jgi:hypothetical protein